MGRGNGGGSAVELKVVMVGDVSVGKTSIANRFSSDEFREDVRTTLGSTCLFRELDINGQAVRFSVWDTAGQEVYHSMVPVYFRQAAAVVLVYDVTSPQSYEGAKRWMAQVEEHAPSDVVVAVVGNKIDLPATVEADDFDPADFATVKLNVSAKTGQNIEDVFRKIYAKCAVLQPNPNRNSTATVTLSALPERGSKCAC
eukprot:TRINITY_DN3464_c0_g1_i1.p1 TRINITY_DN3464_c0_g1~~TRINITY_DN3464_c0_g1_i1.p1  ORF type:complete len:199 (+),score=63.15 TRINITY_DN3464_c0_g1_i1:352-948(+)